MVLALAILVANASCATLNDDRAFYQQNRTSLIAHMATDKAELNAILTKDYSQAAGYLATYVKLSNDTPYPELRKDYQSAVAYWRGQETTIITDGNISNAGGARYLAMVRSRVEEDQQKLARLDQELAEIDEEMKSCGNF